MTLGAMGLYLDVNQMLYDGESVDDALIKGYAHLLISYVSDYSVKKANNINNGAKAYTVPIRSVSNYVVSSVISLCYCNWFDYFYDLRRTRTDR